MGPITLFDKSFLQSISLVDRFFMPVVCPVFYVETLGDLGKGTSRLGPAENAVIKDVAQKFPEMGGSLCASHVDIAISDLLGLHVPMEASHAYDKCGNLTGLVDQNVVDLSNGILLVIVDILFVVIRDGKAIGRPVRGWRVPQ
jgi:tetrahydromethanopterin S-methyltransferase subunit E